MTKSIVYDENGKIKKEFHGVELKLISDKNNLLFSGSLNVLGGDKIFYSLKSGEYILITS